LGIIKKAECEEEKRGMEILKNNPNVHSQVKSSNLNVCFKILVFPVDIIKVTLFKLQEY